MTRTADTRSETDVSGSTRVGALKEAARQVSYRNSWHRPGATQYGPAVYSTDARPTEYRGFTIYERVRGSVWDVVRNGECVAQRAGLNGAKAAIDAKHGSN